MSTLSESPEYSDVLNDSYITSSITVTTTAIEAKVGANRLIGRESLMVYNKGTKKIFAGPSGVTSLTGVVIEVEEVATFSFGENIGVFLITDSGSSTVVVQEAG